MKKAFPHEPVRFAYGWEGPLTSAYELRGDEVFTDLFDDPPAMKQFLKDLTKSIVDFYKFCAKVEGAPEVNPNSGYLCDDIAAMVPPHMFDEMVIPYWEQYFSGITTGKRGAHVEDLRAGQLKYLKKIKLIDYDPSVSPKLTPKIVRDECRIPFCWRLASFDYRRMTISDMSDFVFQSVADGTNVLFTFIEAFMLDDVHLKKMDAFIKAAKEAQKMFDSGASREDIGMNVSVAGKKKFWDDWKK